MQVEQSNFETNGALKKLPYFQKESEHERAFNTPGRADVFNLHLRPNTHRYTTQTQSTCTALTAYPYTSMMLGCRKPRMMLTSFL